MIKNLFNKFKGTRTQKTLRLAQLLQQTNLTEAELPPSVQEYLQPKVREAYDHNFVVLKDEVQVEGPSRITVTYRPLYRNGAAEVPSTGETFKIVYDSAPSPQY